MERYPGQRRGTWRYLYQGYFYYKDCRGQRENEDKYICQRRNSVWNCSVTAIQYPDGYVQVFGVHEHPQADVRLAIRRQEMILTLRWMAVRSYQPPQEIFLEVSRRFRDVAYSIRPEAARAHIVRARRIYRPAMPETVRGLGQMLENYVVARPIFRAALYGDDGSSAIIFAGDVFIRELNDVTELHMDATFRCIPNYPRCSQLFIIHLRKRDIGIAAIFVLCERRTTSMYNLIWDYLKQVAPELTINLRVAIVDYERALISSLRQSFPSISIRGCWFHFTRAVTRKWRALHLNNADRTLLEMTWALPLLPAANLRDGINALQAEARRIEDTYENVVVFIRYLERTWLPIGNMVSVRSSSIRTNNLAENFNRQLVTKLGGPFPELFHFIDRLTIVIEQQEDILESIRDGIYEGRRRRNNQATVDSFISELQRDFDNQRITVREFLMSMRNRNLQNRIEEHNVGLDDQYDQNPPDFPDLVDLQDPPYIEPVPDPIIVQRRRRYRVRARGARRPVRQRTRRQRRVRSPQQPVPQAVQQRVRRAARQQVQRAVRSPTPPVVPRAAPLANMNISDFDSDSDSDGYQSDVFIPEDINIHDQLEMLNFPEDEEAVGDNVCCNCLVNLPKIMLMPCQHACLCFRCNAGKDLLDRLKRERRPSFRPFCPICRRQVINAVAVPPENLVDPPRSDSDNNDGDNSDVPVPEGIRIYDQLEILNFSEDEEATGDDTCCTCLVNKPKVILTPCHHACLCLRCNKGKELMDEWKQERRASFRPSCPMCRHQVHGTIMMTPPDFVDKSRDADTDSDGYYSDVSVPEDIDIYDQLGVLNFPGDEEATGDDDVCCNCRQNKTKVILTPCKHACLCLRCNAGKDIVDTFKREKSASFKPSCPVCGKRVNHTILLI